MTWGRLVKAEIRKLMTTKMPWVFLAVIVALGALTAAVVVFGTDMDGSKQFISTAEDQRSLIAFAANATIGAGLFGAIAAAREYGHGTAVPMFLITPRRTRAVGAQLTAVALGGAVLSVIGAIVIAGSVVLTLPTTEFGFLVSAAGVAQIVAASMIAGAAGAVLGAGVGLAIRNTGGAVTAAVLLLFIAPPLAVQLVPEAASWVPGTLAWVLSGVTDEVSVLAAMLGLAVWAAVPAGIGLLLVHRRDVV